MSIVDLKIVTICGQQNDKMEVLDRLQMLGCIHLSPLSSKGNNTEIQQAAENPVMAIRALKYLSDCPNKRYQLRYAPSFSLQDIVDRTLENKRRSLEMSDRREVLLQHLHQTKPWGDFELPPPEAISGLRFFFYRVPHYKLNRIDGELSYQVVHRDNRIAYVVAISHEEPSFQQIPFTRSRINEISLGALHRELERCNIALDDLKAEREALTQYIRLIASDLARAEDDATLARVARETLDDDGVFAVEGFVPTCEIDVLIGFAERNAVAVLIRDPSPEDNPPTLLNNPEHLSGGEELLSFYQTPSYFEWDPSPSVLFSFALFFAVILSDAGYGSLLFLILLFYWKRLGKNPKGRRLRELSLLVAVTSVLYGIIAGSFFGMGPSEGSPWERVRVFDLTRVDVMMRFSIGIGCFHLIVAHGATAIRLRKSLRALASLGWVAVIGGAFSCWIGLSDEFAATAIPRVSKAAMAIGALSVLVFSSDRPIRSVTDVGWRFLKGLYALTGLSKAFGDVLSYLRLFALGLASFYLAITFNRLAHDIRDAVPGVGLLLSILVLLIGHALNFVLSFASGVIHGLRLNLIEFLNWSLQGEGHPFKRFEKKEKRAWTQ